VVRDEIVGDTDRSRVEAAYERDAQRMWRALFSFSGDREIASDAMAEAFARALRDTDQVRDVASWTWKVAFRLTAQELRRRSEAHTVVDDVTYEMREPVPELMDALKRLTPNQRLAVILHDYADRPTSEVAEVLRCSRATVYVHLSQGRRRLRSYLEDE
jgi:RNA polymerase sigma factor (sigma-70 family)